MTEGCARTRSRRLFADQMSWIEERQSNNIMVDGDVPECEVASPETYLPAEGMQLLAVARDATSGIDSLEMAILPEHGRLYAGQLDARRCMRDRQRDDPQRRHLVPLLHPRRRRPLHRSRCGPPTGSATRRNRPGSRSSWTTRRPRSPGRRTGRASMPNRTPNGPMHGSSRCPARWPTPRSPTARLPAASSRTRSK